MSELTQVRVHDGSIVDAAADASDTSEPVLVPIHPYVDDRGWSYMNQLQGVLSPEGQINFSMQHPGVIKAWHRHDRQTDFWLCVLGHFKAGIHRESDDRRWITTIGQMRPAVLIIPPPLWHGVATVGSEPAGLLYYVTRAYDAATPDEHRRPWNALPDFPWETTHG
ncbi:MAG: dTDP-4-dehydrorhamnose 3,5-epimerase [Phycisphaerae bacterium]